MNAADQNQSPEEIERRIEATRQQLNATLNALQNKLDPGELMDTVWTYLRGNSSELGKSLVETVRANPIPVLLLGVGVSWLALGGSVPGRPGLWRGRHPEDEYTQSYDSNLGYEGGRAEAYPPGAVGYSTASGGGMTGKAKESWQAAKEKVSEAAAKVKGRTSEMADKITDRTKETMEHMGERAHEMKDRLSHKLHTSDMGASDTGDRASSGVSDKYQQMADRSQELYQRSMDRASQMSHGMRERYARQKYRARTLLEEHPLAVAAIGIGIGAFLGAILPSSRREQRWLQDTRDEMSGVGQSMLQAGREQFERAREVVERTAQSVREQAEQARHSDESLGESASRAAGAAKETARQELKKEDRAVTTPPHTAEPRKPITPPL